MTEPRFRPIAAADDAAVADLIRRTLVEFDCVGCGYASSDPEVDAMTAAYPGGVAQFYVIEDHEGVAGCGGFAPLRGADSSVAELRKMYFEPRLRGRGVGSRFLAFLLGRMREAGFVTCYLETTTQMQAAQALYRRHGFVQRDAAMGATGHSSCDLYFARALAESEQSADSSP